MNSCTLTVLAVAALALPLPLAAQTPTPHYQWTPGQTLRYLIQRDPYFADPKSAFETIATDAPYRAPVVERLTEQVQSVAPDGTATLTLTLGPEPGFEDEAAPEPTLTRTVVVSPAGRVLSISGGALGQSAADRDLLRGINLLPAGLTGRTDGLAAETHTEPAAVFVSKTRGHDGILVHTTAAAVSDHLVFDCLGGRMEREVSTMTITMSLVMTGRGRRGSDDFGHVIPNVQMVQTLTIERQAD